MAYAMDELLNQMHSKRFFLCPRLGTQLTEAREAITAELREEFAQRYENDKSKLLKPQIK